ncbi:hypothetical protein TMatcc_009324 [Talaromyces marneffei ATCC 18224]
MSFKLLIRFVIRVGLASEETTSKRSTFCSESFDTCILTPFSDLVDTSKGHKISYTTKPQAEFNYSAPAFLIAC